MKGTIWAMKGGNEYEHHYIVGFETDYGIPLDVSFFVTVMGRKKHMPLFDQLIGAGKKKDVSVDSLSEKVKGEDEDG